MVYQVYVITWTDEELTQACNFLTEFLSLSRWQIDWRLTPRLHRKANFCQSVGAGNQHRRLRNANKKQCIILYVTLLKCYVVCSKHSSYTKATSGYLIAWLSCLIIITLAPSPTQNQIPHSLFDIFSIGLVAVKCPAQDNDQYDSLHMIVHICARSKFSQHNIANNVVISPELVSGQQWMCIDREQLIQLTTIT